MHIQSYWWARYGTFPPGMYQLPHMGKVIAAYREKLYRTQEDFAIAAGVDKRTVQEWETAIMTADYGRRIFLAKMLKIPPALLGLDWRQVVYDKNTGEYTDPLGHMAELLEEDAYETYEDILVMGHEYIHNGGSENVILRVDRRLYKLAKITKHARPTERDNWKALLCRFYQLSTRIKQQCLMDDHTALIHANEAVTLAQELEDAELLAAAYVNSACTYTQQGNLADARNAIAKALTYTEKIRPGALKGNIYLEAANITAPFAREDRSLQAACKVWQDKAAIMLYKGIVEPDESFFRFNLSAVNHEKAKTLLRWQKTKEERKGVRTKLNTAIDTLSPDLTVWKTYYFLTEADLYLADHDIEASATAGKEALKVATAMHSQMGQTQVKQVYTSLNTIAPRNPYVRNLGMELGFF